LSRPDTPISAPEHLAKTQLWPRGLDRFPQPAAAITGVPPSAGGFCTPIQARHERRLADLLLCTCSRAEVIKGSFPSGFPSGQGFTPRGGPRATIQIS
jgi:hypothetical protein